MDDLTRITHTPAGYRITTGYELLVAADADRKAALVALFHRGFTPQSAVASLDMAARLGAVLVKGLASD